jgi:hypothetical protein
MRKLVFTAAAAATLFGAIGAGIATDFQHQVNLRAQALNACSIGAAPAPTGEFTNVGVSSSTLTVNFSGGNVLQQSASLNFGNVVCTGPSTTISLARSFLQIPEPERTTAAAAGFTTKIDYTAALNWGGGENLLSLAANQGTGQTIVGPKTGAFILNINVPGNTGPFIANLYSDLLTLTVSPST